MIGAQGRPREILRCRNSRSWRSRSSLVSLRVVCQRFVVHLTNGCGNTARRVTASVQFSKQFLGESPCRQTNNFRDSKAHNSPENVIPVTKKHLSDWQTKIPITKTRNPAEKVCYRPGKMLICPNGSLRNGKSYGHLPTSFNLSDATRCCD